jgi:hypothetical protein
MLKVCCQNQLKWLYALADNWLSSSVNMKYIHATLEKQFIFALKSNRLIALNKEDKAKGRYVFLRLHRYISYFQSKKTSYLPRHNAI